MVKDTKPTDTKKESKAETKAIVRPTTAVQLTDLEAVRATISKVGTRRAGTVLSNSIREKIEKDKSKTKTGTGFTDGQINESRILKLAVIASKIEGISNYRLNRRAFFMPFTFPLAKLAETAAVVAITAIAEHAEDVLDIESLRTRALNDPDLEDEIKDIKKYWNITESCSGLFSNSLYTKALEKGVIVPAVSLLGLPKGFKFSTELEPFLNEWKLQDAGLRAAVGGEPTSDDIEHVRHAMIGVYARKQGQFVNDSEIFSYLRGYDWVDDKGKKHEEITSPLVRKLMNPHYESIQETAIRMKLLSEADIKLLSESN